MRRACDVICERFLAIRDRIDGLYAELNRRDPWGNRGALSRRRRRRLMRKIERLIRSQTALVAQMGRVYGFSSMFPSGRAAKGPDA